MADQRRPVIVVDNDGEIQLWNPFFGVFPIRQDITVLPADEPRQLKLGWTVREVTGVGIINKRSK